MTKVHPASLLPDKNNNEKYLSGKKQYSIILNKDDLPKIEKYIEEVGTTSLSRALTIIGHNNERQMPKALEDLILMRFILDEKIIFEYKKDKFFGLVKSTITKGFKPLYVNDEILDKMVDEDVKKLVEDLESGNDNPEIFKMFIKDIMLFLGVDSISIIFPIIVGLGHLSIGFIIIGLVVSIFAIKIKSNYQDRIIRKAIVLIIDYIIVHNDSLIDIINSEGEPFMPKLFNGDTVAMAMYFQYIKNINKKYINSSNTRNIIRRKQIKNNIGVAPLNLEIFTKKGDEICGICLSLLAETSDKGRAIEVCENHHMFHTECIQGWIGKDKTECPLCKKDIKPELLKRGGGRFTRKKHLSKRRVSRKN